VHIPFAERLKRVKNTTQYNHGRRVGGQPPTLEKTVGRWAMSTLEIPTWSENFQAIICSKHVWDPVENLVLSRFWARCNGIWALQNITVYHNRTKSCRPTAGPPGIPVLKTQNSPRQRKNSRKFPFGKMLDYARSNTMGTQTSNIYLNQLQCNDMVSLQKCTMLFEVLKGKSRQKWPMFLFASSN